MYLADKLHKQMDVLLPPEQFIGHEISYEDLSKRLNELTRKVGAKIRVARDDQMDKKKRLPFDISGYYDASRKYQQIVLTLYVPKSKNALVFTKGIYNMLRFDVSRVLQHELVHQHQFAVRPEITNKVIAIPYSNNISKDKKANILYLSEQCEIEAYAHDIAMEIRWFYPEMNPMTVMKNIDKYRNVPSYRFYKRVFANTEWEKIKKMLFKKAIRWASTAKVPQKF